MMPRFGLRRRARPLAALLMLVSLSVMCDDAVSPTRPTPAHPTVQGVSLVGPVTVAPGQSVQFAVEATYSDGHREPWTAPVEWRSSNPTLASVTSTGVVTGHERGLATITVAGGSMIAAQDTAVVPTGTYWVDGTLTAAGAQSYQLAGAGIELLTGDATASSRQADESGRFGLFGVSGHVAVRISLPGYETRTVELDVAFHQKISVELTPLLQTDFVGPYTLTLTASPECHGRLPDAALERRYSASPHRAGVNVSFWLGGATFTGPSGFEMKFMPGSISDAERVVVEFTPYGYYYGPTPSSMVEVLAPGRLFVPVGSATLTKSGGIWSGSLAGSISIYVSLTEIDPGWGCTSSSHRLTLTR